MLFLCVGAFAVVWGSPLAVGPAAAGQREHPADASEATTTLRFAVEEVGKYQTLEVRERVGGSIEVAITIRGSCGRSEAGIAAPVSPESDADVEVDPDGEGHPTDTFFLTPRPECTIGIRLAAGERPYAWLRESGCNRACLLSEEPMTRK
jgi:hypothetical protein